MIHLTYQSGNKPVVACNCGTNTTEYRVYGVVQHYPHGHGLSGDPRAVTCAACRGSEMFKRILEQIPK